MTFRPEMNWAKTLIRIIFTGSLAFVSLGTRAQTTADCANLLIVCGTTSLALNSNGIGTNDFANANNQQPSCGFRETQSLWLKVPITQSGNLDFVITANNGADDFDFAIYGPNVSCNNLGAAVRCSSTNPQAAGVSANTGLRAGESDTGEGPGALGNGFVSPLPVVSGEEYIILIDNFSRSNAGFQLSWGGSATISNPPVANQPSNITACDPDGDGLTTFDLNSAAAEILNAQAGAVLSFHNNETDALTGVNPITDPSNYSNTVNGEVIYARLTASGSGCSDVTNFQLDVLDEPVVDEVIGATSVCPDVDGVPYTMTGSSISNYAWFVEGGDITSGQATDAITVDWKAANDNARVKLLVSNANGCAIDTVFYDVKINKRLEPEKPVGNDAVCYADKENVLYQVPFVPGSEYEWGVINGSINGANNQNSVMIDWDDNVTSGRVFFREFNPSIADCEGFSDTLDIQVLPEIFVASQLIQPLCNGASNGSIALTVSGGIGDKKILWNTGAANTSLNNVTAGTYEYTITDDTGCPITGEIVLAEPDELMVTDVLPTDTQCFNTLNGSAEITVQGGTGSYSYNWTGPGFSRQTTINRVTNLARGEYNVEITDENGCVTNESFVIGSPPLLEADLSALVNMEICPGTSDGEIQIDAIGGVPDYEFFWTPTNQTGRVASGLSAGGYTVRIVDANGCEATYASEVTEFTPRVHFPNAFSPNGDGENDQYGPIVGCQLPSYNFKIYNRWGQLVFFSEDQNAQWDATFEGQDVPDGRYSYTAFYRVAVNGVVFEETLNGFVRIFR